MSIGDVRRAWLLPFALLIFVSGAVVLAGRIRPSVIVTQQLTSAIAVDLIAIVS